jgi:hypothetical protein
MTSRFAPLLALVFVLVLPGCTQTFLIDGKPAVLKWSPFHKHEKPLDSPKASDTDRQAALLNFLTEDIKEETIFPARIAEIVDSKNESFLALVALFSLLFFARLHKHQNQTRPNSLNTDDLARLQILKDTAARLLKRHKRKSKIIDLNDFRD